MVRNMNTFPSTLWIVGILGTILLLGRREDLLLLMPYHMS